MRKKENNIHEIQVLENKHETLLVELTKSSAIQTYAQRSIGSEMKGFTYSSVRLMMDRAGENYVVTLHSVDDPDPDWNHRATLRVVEGDGFRLNNQYLEILTELLTEEILSVDEEET